MYNKNIFRKANDKKLLHKIGKQWITVSIAMLALLGGSVLTTHITHADSISTQATNTSKVNKLIKNQSGSNNDPNSQKHIQEPQLKTSNKAIQSSASDLHQHLLNKATINSPNLPAKAIPNNSVQHFNSTYENYLKQNPQLASAYNNENVQSNNQMNKPKRMLGSDTPMYSAGRGTVFGLSYKADANGNVEFTGGVADSDLSNLFNAYNGGLSGISPSGNHDAIKSITFDNGVNTSHVTNMSNMLYDNEKLRAINFGNSFNTGRVSNMSDMFGDDTSLQTINGLSDFNTDHVTNMNLMFSQDYNLKYLNLSHFNINKSTSIENMLSDDHLQSITLSPNCILSTNALPQQQNPNGIIEMSGTPQQRQDLANYVKDANPNSTFISELNNYLPYAKISPRQFLVALQNGSDIKFNYFDAWEINDALNTIAQYTPKNMQHFISLEYAHVANPVGINSNDQSANLFDGQSHPGTWNLVLYNKNANNNIYFVNQLNHQKIASDNIGGKHFLGDNVSVGNNPHIDISIPNNTHLVNGKTSDQITLGLKPTVVQIVPNNDISYSDIYRSIDGLTNPTSDHWNGTGYNHPVTPTGWAFVDANGQPSEAPQLNSNNKVMIAPVYDGLTYKYDKKNGYLEFTGGKINVSDTSNFLNVSQFGGAVSDEKDYISDRPVNNKLTSVKFDSDIDTSGVNNMASMFSDDKTIQTLNLGNAFNTRNVTSMTSMFASDYSLSNLTLPNSFDTSNVVSDMADMFAGDVNLRSLDLGPNFDTSKVIEMNDMFAGDVLLQLLDLGLKFNTKSCHALSQMFAGDVSLESLNLGPNFDTSNIDADSGMAQMFAGDMDLTSLDLGNHFNTSNVPRMNQMFAGDISLQSLNLGNQFSTKGINPGSDDIYNGLAQMFAGDISLKNLVLPSDFNNSNVNMLEMFSTSTSQVLNEVLLDKTAMLKEASTGNKDGNMYEYRNKISNDLPNYLSNTSILPNQNLQSLTIQSPTLTFKSNAGLPNMYKQLPYKDNKGHNYTLSTPNDFSKRNSGTFVSRLNNFFTNNSNQTKSNLSYIPAINFKEALNINSVANSDVTSASADINSADIISQKATDNKLYQQIQSDVNKVTQNKNKAQSCAEDIANDSKTQNVSNALTKLNLANAYINDASNYTNSANSIINSSMTRIKPNIYNFSRAIKLVNHLSASINTSTANHIHDTVNDYMSSIKADVNSTEVINEVRSDNYYYNQMTSLINQLNSINLQVERDVNQVNLDTKEPKNKLSASKTNTDLTKAIKDNNAANKLVNNIKTLANKINDQIKPKIYNFNRASKAINSIHPVSINTSKATAIDSTVNDYALSLNDDVNTSSISSEIQADNTDYAQLTSLNHDTDYNNGLASSYVNDFKRADKFKNASMASSALSNAESTHQKAKQFANQEESAINKITDDVIPIHKTAMIPTESTTFSMNTSSSASTTPKVTVTKKPRTVSTRHRPVLSNHKKSTLIRKDHRLYIKIYQPILLHTNIKAVGHVRDYAFRIKPSQHLTLFVSKIIHVGKLTRYVIHYHGHNYFITANKKFVRNSYWQKRDLHAKHYVKVIRNAFEYRHAQYNEHGQIRMWHHGSVLPYKSLRTIAKHQMTRFQLLNGHWITANKNFVKLI